MAVTYAPEFVSGMTFLKNYASEYEERKDKLAALEEKLEKLSPAVEEAKKISEEIKEINNLNKASEKFLMSMNEVVLAHTGQPIDNGPMFNQPTGEADGN